MKKGRTAITFAVGVFAGLALCGPAAQAANIALTAAPTSQTFYINGQQVQFEAYEIHGNNFVKLRDIGKAVNFGVEYHAADNTVHIVPDAPYTEEVTPSAPITPTAPPAPTPSSPSDAGGYTITADHWSREDFSRQANPSVFTGPYDRNLYNAIRQTLVDGAPGDNPAYTMVSKADYSAVKKLLGRMDGTGWLEFYVPQNFTNYYEYLDYFAVGVKIPEQYNAAQEFIQPVIAQASQLVSDRKRVEYLHDYLCTLLAYDVTATADISQIFSSHSGELKGACGSYATAFSYLCDAANIPCFMVRSADHSWNMVYARWLYVDVSADDLRQNKAALLQESYPRHTDIAPEATAFLKELLVPGSTK